MRRGFLFRVGNARSRRASQVSRHTSGLSGPTRRLLYELLEDRRVLSIGAPAFSAPVVDAGLDATVNEGSLFAGVGSLSDPDSQSWSASVNYGDGSGLETLSLNADRTFQLSHVYADNGVFPVTVTVTDEGQLPGVDTVQVTVNNMIPNLFVCGKRTVAEGTPLSIQDIGMFTDPGFDNVAGGTVERFTYNINWGDGSNPDSGSATVDVPGSAGKVTRGTFNGTHTYANDGQYSVALTVNDDDNGSSVTRLVTALVTNAPPVITGVSLDKTVIIESESVVLTGAFADPGGSDTHTAIVNWGDGETSNAVVDPVARTFTAPHQYLNHPATTPPQYTIVVTVQDNSNGSDTESLLVTVNPAPPVVNAGDDQTASEGQTVTFSGAFTDQSVQDTHTILWDFGDGSTVSGTLTPTHVFADNGTYTVKLTVTDSDQQSQTDTLIATVTNVTPTLTVPGLQTVAEGALLDLTQIGQFTDPGFTNAAASTNETFTYSVNWGDGTVPSAGDVATVQQGGPDTLTHGTFGGSHVYADNGTYTVTVTVTDDDGGATSQSFQATVANVAPTLGVIGNQQAIAGVLLNLTDVGVFTDPGFANALNVGGEVTETFTYTINWGDSTTLSSGAATIDQAGSPGILTGGSFDGSHTYSLAGTYVVTARVTDDDNGFGEQLFDIVVTAPAQSQQSGSAMTDGLVDTLSPDTLPPVTASSVTLTRDVAVGEATANEPPTVWGPGNLTIDEGPFTMSDLGNFLDPDSTGPFGYSIGWGDGTAATTGTATIDLPGPPSAGSFDGSHAYGDNGLFDLSLAVTDEQGGTSTEVFEMTVNNVAPQLENVVTTTPISEGGTATLTGNILDPGTGDPHVLVVTWGDGETNTYQYAAGTTSFRETHRYLSNKPQDAPYAIHLELTDDDEPDKPATADLSIVVKNMAPNVVDDIYVHIGGGLLTVDAAQGVLANDTDPGNDLLTVTEYGSPSAGTLVGQADGSFVYTPPNDDFSGIVRFTYKAMDSDGAISANTATVTIDSALNGGISGFVRIPFVSSSLEPIWIGIPGVTITLTETTDQDVVRTTTITGDDGSYHFGGLRVGTYTVTETHPAALLPGGTDAQQVVLKGDDLKTDINFVEGWLRTYTVSLRNYFASAPPLETILTPSNLRQVIARAEEQAGHAAQAEAIRAGGSHTTVLIAGTSGDDSIRFTAGPTHHRVYVNNHPLVFVAAEVEAFKIDGGGGRDTAQLVGSTSADTVTLRPAPESSILQLPDYSMQGAAYVVTVEHVEHVTAAGGGGYDRAYLFDSAGDDLLSLEGKSARLTPWGTDEFSLEAIDFDWVRAAGTSGGQNSKQLNGPLDFVLETEGNWTD